MLHQAETIARVLGLPQAAEAGHLALALRVERGLPISALDRVMKAVAPHDPGLLYRVVPRSTLSRRRQARALSADESNRLARLAKIWAQALHVWKSDDEARDFLFRRHALLGGETPFALALGSDFGADMVMQVLGRLEYGTAA